MVAVAAPAVVTRCITSIVRDLGGRVRPFASARLEYDRNRQWWVLTRASSFRHLNERSCNTARGANFAIILHPASRAAILDFVMWRTFAPRRWQLFPLSSAGCQRNMSTHHNWKGCWFLEITHKTQVSHLCDSAVRTVTISNDNARSNNKRRWLRWNRGTENVCCYPRWLTLVSGNCAETGWIIRFDSGSHR